MSTPIRLRPIPVWHGRWGPAELRKLRESGPGGERAYRRGYQLQALSDEEKTFPSFESCYSHVALGEVQRSKWMAVTGVDLAGDKRPGNVIFTAMVNPKDRRRYPVDIRYGSWRADETLEQIAQVDALYHPTVIMVENNGFQQALIDFCQSSPSKYDFWMKLEPTTTGSNKMDPTLGLPGLQIEFRNHAWVIPHNEYESHPSGPHEDSSGRQCGWCLWDNEMRNYPLSATTDAVMACWFCRQGIELFGAPLDLSGLEDLRKR